MMTNTSQTITFTFSVNKRVAEISAWVAGFMAVALPFAVAVKTINGPSPTHIPLPMVYEAPSAERYLAVDERELDCLASNIYYESRNQPGIGRLAVGITTLIRVREAGWPDSICKVVKQPKQFSWVGKEHEQNQRASNGDVAYLRALSLSNRILSGDYDNLISLFRPTHFHTVSVNPKWNRNLAKLARINDHIFYE